MKAVCLTTALKRPLTNSRMTKCVLITNVRKTLFIFNVCVKNTILPLRCFNCNGKKMEDKGLGKHLATAVVWFTASELHSKPQLDQRGEKKYKIRTRVSTSAKRSHYFNKP